MNKNIYFVFLIYFSTVPGTVLFLDKVPYNIAAMNVLRHIPSSLLRIIGKNGSRVG